MHFVYYPKIVQATRGGQVRLQNKIAPAKGYATLCFHLHCMRAWVQTVATVQPVPHKNVRPFQRIRHCQKLMAAKTPPMPPPRWTMDDGHLMVVLLARSRRWFLFILAISHFPFSAKRRRVRAKALSVRLGLDPWKHHNYLSCNSHVTSWSWFVKIWSSRVFHHVDLCL